MDSASDHVCGRRILALPNTDVGEAVIFPGQVQKIAEGFIKQTLIAYPRTVDALLSHPLLPDWYRRLAEELTRMQTEAAAMRKAFDPAQEILAWAGGFVESTLARADASRNDSVREIRSTLPQDDPTPPGAA